MPFSILSAGVAIPGGEIEYVRFSERPSLLDWDIIIATTDLTTSFYFGDDTYQGKSSLSDDSSFKLKEGLAHWRREIKDSVQAGKGVVVFLDEYVEFFVATGDRTHSGTGRNRQTTRIVSQTNNYELIPLKLEPVTSVGNKMLLDPKASYLKTLFEEFQGALSYNVTFSSEAIKTLVTTKVGKKSVGGIVQNKETGGYLLLLPMIDLDQKEFTETRGGKKYWSEKGSAFGKKFVSSLVALHEAITVSNGKSPKPDWVGSEDFLLDAEVEIRGQMTKTEEKINKLQDQLSQSKQKLEEAISIKDLLFEQGKPLEWAVLRALKDFGFTTHQYKENDSEFDVVFESPEGRLLGEVEGKDNKPINVDKLRQLEMNINEDFEREEVTAIAKGVLFGNPMRLLPPKARTEAFTEKCVIAANRSGTALVRTQDLFEAWRFMQTGGNDVAGQIRNRIIESVGIVTFEGIIPPSPDTKVESGSA